MSFTSRLSNSWSLFKKSLAVMNAHPRLLVFPAVIFVFTLGILGFFLAPVVLQPTGHSLRDPAHWSAVADSVFTKESIEAERAAPGDRNGERLVLTPKAMVYAILIYFASMFLATFFATAFYHEILSALQGGGVSIAGGLRFATSKLYAIVLWSLFAGLIGVLIRMLEERVGIIGKWIVRAIGIAWSVASVFAIPIIVSEEEANPIAILKRSAETLRKTWGESLTGFLGIQLGGGLVLIGSVVLFTLVGMLAANLHIPILIIPFAILWLLCLFAFFYTMGVASNIYRCALYLFAAQGEVPSYFDRESMDMAWKRKKS
ncbi:MAG: DUF6159 family protein [Steroidobacteraceae bacterium]